MFFPNPGSFCYLYAYDILVVSTVFEDLFFDSALSQAEYLIVKGAERRHAGMYSFLVPSRKK